MYGYAEQILQCFPTCVNCGKSAVGVGIYLIKVEQKYQTQEIRSYSNFPTQVAIGQTDIEGEVRLFPACEDCILGYEFRNYLFEPPAKEVEKIKVEVEKLFERRRIKLPKEKQNEEVV